MGDELIKVKAGVAGAEVELAVGESLPTALAKVFPKWALRTEMRRGITASILQKLETGEPIDRADADFAAAVFGEAEAVWLRRKEIAMRAKRVLTETPALPTHEVSPQLPPHESASSSPPTADEWIRRFWEDASAISDEVLQEIYARVLAGEVRHPTSCSLRTLRTLRYMDRRTADNFAELLRFVVDHDCLYSGMGDSAERADQREVLPFDVLRDLDDAGLLDFRPDVVKVLTGPGPFRFRWAKEAFQVRFVDAPPDARHHLGCYLLTEAGRQLARVSNVAAPEGFGNRLAHHFRSQLPGAELKRAQLPSPTWIGRHDEVTWTAF